MTSSGIIAHVFELHYRQYTRAYIPTLLHACNEIVIIKNALSVFNVSSCSFA